MGRLRRFLSPQLADLIVDVRATSRSWRATGARSSSCSATCGGFTAFAETAEPEEVMGVLGEYHAALGDLIFRFEGTLEHFAGDGLMVFFNDPLPCDDAPARADADGRRDAQPGAGPGRRLGRARARPGLRRSASPRAMPRSAGSGSRAGSTTPPSAASPTSRPGCAREAAPWQILVTQRVHAGAEDIVVSRAGRRARRCAGSADRSRAFDDQRARRGAGDVMTLRMTRSPATTRATSTEEERYRALRPAAGADGRRLAARCGSTRRASRSSSIPSVTLDRVGRAERDADAGLRGAVPVPAPAAAPAAAADDLRDVDADRAVDRRVLPRPAARGHPEPCPGPARPRLGQRRVAAAAEREAARTAAAAAPDRGADPGPRRARTSCRTTPRRSSATSPWRSASRCTAPTRGCSRSAPRPAAAGCSREEGVRHPLGVRGPAHDRRGPRRDRSAAGRAGRRVHQVHRQAQRGGLRRGQRAGRPRRPAGARGRPTSGTRWRQRVRADGVRGAGHAVRRATSPSSPSAAASSRSASPGSSCAAPACSCG